MSAMRRANLRGRLAKRRLDAGHFPRCPGGRTNKHQTGTRDERREKTNQASHGRRILHALARIFLWSGRSMGVTVTITGGILLVNGILYAFRIGGFAPDQVVAAMSWLIAPVLALLDLAAPPVAWMIRFVSSIWSVSAVIGIMAVLSGVAGMTLGTVLFIRELFRFQRKEDSQNV